MHIMSCRDDGVHVYFLVAPMSIVSDEIANLDGKYHGVKMETAPVTLMHNTYTHACVATPPKIAHQHSTQHACA